MWYQCYISMQSFQITGITWAGENNMHRHGLVETHANNFWRTKRFGWLKAKVYAYIDVVYSCFMGDNCAEYADSRTTIGHGCLYHKAASITPPRCPIKARCSVVASLRAMGLLMQRSTGGNSKAENHGTMLSYNSAWAAFTQSHPGYPWEQFTSSQATFRRSSNVEVKN